MEDKLKEEETRISGIDIMGNVPWGMHFCQFYETKNDLIDVLVPYFKAGLENNEYCMWVTSEPLNKNETRGALEKAMPDFNKYLKRRQIEIVPYDKWYLRDGVFNPKRVFSAWIDKLNHALSNGYDGIRVTGNTAWLEKNHWKSFTDYEEKLSKAIGAYRMIAVCSYPLDKSSASEIIDVVSNHQFALIKRKSNWVVIESSEHRRVEKALKESEENFRVLLNATEETAFLMDLDGKVLVISNTGAKKLGRTVDDIVGKNIFRMIPPEIAKNRWNKTREAIVIKKRTHLRDTQAGIIFDIDFYPITNSDGKVTHVGVHAKDVTNEIMAEGKIRAGERKYRELVENMHDGLLQVDNQDRILFVNDQLCKMLGYTRNELLGRIGCKMLFSRADQKTVRYNNARRLKKLADKYEIQMRKKSGERIWVQISGSPVVDQGGKVQGSIGIIADINERKKVEARLYHTLRELEAERQKIVGLAHRIIQVQERERRYLAAGVHDELLQSLVAVLYFLQMIDTTSLGHDIRKQKARLLEIIKISIDRGRQLIQEMAPIGYPQLNVIYAIKKYINLNFDGDNLKVKVISPKNLPSLSFALRTNILRIVQEALMNVRRHAQSTKVTVRISVVKNRLNLKISDNGVGFVPKTITDSIVGHYGLLTMRERARLVNGELNIISRPGKGTIVSGSLPLKIREHSYEKDQDTYCG